jgi:hypothetical protein
MLPIGYVVRNLLRRRARTLITLAGIAATTLLVIAMLAFANGVAHAGAAGAREDVVVLLGTSAEVDLVRSVVPRGSAEVAAAAAPGVLTVDGQRAASVELHIATRAGDRIGLLRGVTPAAYLVHTRVAVIEGREPREPFELMVGSLAHTRMGLPASELAVGRTIRLERRDFTIVGRFAAPATVYEAEMWGRLDDVMLATKREDVSCIVLRLAEPTDLADVQLFAARRIDLPVDGVVADDLPPLRVEDAAVFTPEAEDIAAASKAVADPLWRLPLWPGYEEALDGDIADLKNDPDGWAQAGSVTAGLFLKRFAPTTGGWVHLDIFAWNPKSRPGYPVGGEAQAIRIRGQALRETPALIQLQIVEKWDGKSPLVVGGAGQGTNMILPIGNIGK